MATQQSQNTKEESSKDTTANETNNVKEGIGIKRNKTPRVSVKEAKASPMQTRPALSESYEGPISERELWWRCTIKETPIPGSYKVPDNFMGDLPKRPNTYSFKSDGRRLDPMPHIGRGQYLLPGAYIHKGMVEELNKKSISYGFKDSSRDGKDILNFGKKDKDINVPPNVYDTEKYLSLTADKQPSRYWQFKSQSSRFPTKQFKPRAGPGPGEYESSSARSSRAVHVSSSFKSRTPRFVTSHTRTPGPGAYERTFQSPMPKTIMKMGRDHGLYFSSTFQA